MRNRAAEFLPLDRRRAQAPFLGGQRCRDAGRSGADDHDIERVPVRLRNQLPDRVHGLASLLDRVPDQPHAAEFARNEHPRHVRLEIGLHRRDVDTASRRAEHKRDGVGRANRLAGAVTDAVGRADKMCLLADHAEHGVRVLLGARFDAAAAPDALRLVDFGMQRRRLDHALLGRRHEGAKTYFLK